MRAPVSIDAYLKTVAPDRRAALEQLRRSIHRLVPGVEECISYSMPAFRVPGGVIGGFLATKAGCSFYPFSGTTLATLAADLPSYSQTKSALHFVPTSPIPEPLLRKLLRTRLAEIEVALAAKAAKKKTARKATAKRLAKPAKKATDRPTASKRAR